MKIVKVNGKITTEEKEAHLCYDLVSNQWTMDSTIPKVFNKALKQGWTPLVKYEYEDGTAAGYVLCAPYRAITIRNVEPKQMSEKQLGNLSHDNDDEL